MEDEFIDEQIKTMFKIAKKLHMAFSDVRQLTTRYLFKIEKIKRKKQEVMLQRQEKRKKQEKDKKRKQKEEEKKQNKQKQKKRSQQEQQRKMEEQKKAYKKSFISQIKPNRYGDKVQQKSKQPNKATNFQQNKKKSVNDGQNQKPKPKSKSRGKKSVQQNRQNENEKSEKYLKKPVEPETPYFRFLRMKRNEIKSSITNMSATQTTKIMKTVWEKMNDEERRPYIQDYEVQKAKYEREIYQYYNPKRGQVRRPQEKPKQDINQIDFDFIDQLDKM